jgi:transcriptional regulator with XRE-family HTH domain
MPTLEPESEKELELDRVWGKYCESSANLAMASLGEMARRKRLSMRTVAKRVGVDVKAFLGYFESKAPELRTMIKVAKALDLPPKVARALIGQLTQEDVLCATWDIRINITCRGNRLFGNDTEVRKVEKEFIKWCEDDTNSGAFAEACGATILEWYSVPYKESPNTSRSDILGPSLAAVECVTASRGFSLQSFVQDEQKIRDAQAEAKSWCNLLLTTLGVSESDEREIRRILEPYGVLYDLNALMADSYDRSESRLIHGLAEGAAQEAYQERLKGRSAWEYKTDQEFLHEELYRERQIREFLPSAEAEKLIVEERKQGVREAPLTKGTKPSVKRTKSKGSK